MAFEFPYLPPRVVAAAVLLRRPQKELLYQLWEEDHRRRREGPPCQQHGHEMAWPEDVPDERGPPQHEQLLVVIPLPQPEVVEIVAAVAEAEVGVAPEEVVGTVEPQVVVEPRLLLLRQPPPEVAEA